MPSQPEVLQTKKYPLYLSVSFLSFSECFSTVSFDSILTTLDISNDVFPFNIAPAMLDFVTRNLAPK